MASVYNKYRVPAQHLEPGGPAGRGNALPDGGVRDIPAPLPEDGHGLQHHGGVVELVASCQRNLQIGPWTIGEALSIQSEFTGHDLREVGTAQGRALLPASLRKDLVGIGVAAVADHRAAGLDDPGLGPGDVRHRGAQLLHVVQPHGGDHRRLRHVDDVGGVQLPAHAHLQHHDLAVFLPEILHGQGGYQLELRRGVLHGVGVGLDTFGQLRQGLVRDLPPVHLHPLVEAVDEGGGVEANPVTGVFQNRRQHGGGGALAVGTGDVDEFQPFVGIAQLSQKLLGPLQPQLAAHPVDGVDVLERFFIGHMVLPDF